MKKENRFPFTEICFLSLLLYSSYSYSLTNSDSSYYPLALGNEWEYSSNIDPHSEMIVDTLRINEHLFYGFSRTSSEPEYWLREHNNRVYYLNISDSTEFLLYDFTINIGDSIELPLGYECSFGNKIFLVSKSDTVVTPSGTFYNCYHFQHRTSCVDSGIFDSWFAKEIGKVKYIAQYFAGIAEFLLNNYLIVTSLDEKPNKKIIQSYKLFQNYPNPFNPTTTIEYYIPKIAFISINIYDIMGRKIKTLLHEEQISGNHSVTWNGTNNENEKVSSSIYFYRLETRENKIIRKMILLK